MSAFYDLSKTPRNILNQAIVRAIVSENNGALFDPSDLSTLYQDAAGTTPVTAVEQPVGLMLDKSQGLMLGPENLSLPYTGVVFGAWTITSSSVMRNSSASGSAYVTLNSPIKLGKFYKISMTISGKTGDDLIVRLGADSGSYARFSSNGSVSAVLVGVGTTSQIYVSGYAGTAGDAVITNLSVRELYGNHATQSVTASRPTLSARKNILLATEALATQSVTTLPAQYTLSFTGTGSVTLSGTATGTLTGTGADRVSLTFTPTAGTLTLTVSGSVTKAQVELGAVAGQYQRVTTATDYDTDPRYFTKYLKFDGVDDYLNLPYMGLYANGAASIVCARDVVSKATDTYIISERSTTDADPKYFPSRQLASGGNMDAYISDDNAAVVLDTTGSAFGGAADKVIRSVVDTGSNLKLYKNGSIAADDNYTRTGTLTLNNTTIGASVSTTTGNYAKMKLYGLLITKSALSDAQRVRCERFLARKAGVML